MDHCRLTHTRSKKESPVWMSASILCADCPGIPNSRQTSSKYSARSFGLSASKENLKPVKPDPAVIAIFTENLYPKYIENNRVDILMENTAFGVGGVTTPKAVTIINTSIFAAMVATMVHRYNPCSRKTKNSHGNDSWKYPLCFHVPGDRYFK